MINLMNIDCQPFMESCKDNQFSLAIVDTPYGIGANKMQLGNGKHKIYRGERDWDKESPSLKFWELLFKISKNQIIWGANHFISRIPFDSPAWVVWDKGTGDNDFADCELAWTSFNKPVKKFFKSWVGANAKEKADIKRVHPTQKPVQLYKWLLMNYAEEGQTIFDSHCGSGSIMIACYDLGFNLTACEIDKDYFDAANKRFKNHIAQLTIPYENKMD